MLEWAMVGMSAVLVLTALAVLWAALRVVAHAERVPRVEAARLDPSQACHPDVPAHVLPKPRVFVPPPDQAKLLSREADAAAMARRAKLDGYSPDRVRMVG